MKCEHLVCTQKFSLVSFKMKMKMQNTYNLKKKNPNRNPNHEVHNTKWIYRFDGIVQSFSVVCVNRTKRSMNQIYWIQTIETNLPLVRSFSHCTYALTVDNIDCCLSIVHSIAKSIDSHEFHAIMNKLKLVNKSVYDKLYRSRCSAKIFQVCVLGCRQTNYIHS